MTSGAVLPTAIIVYGTLRDAGANRYAAEQWQHNFLNDYESQVPIYKDFAVSDDLLRDHDVVFVGRPESNSALASWSAKLGLDYQGAAFKINNEVHASEREALILAAENPLDASSHGSCGSGQRCSQHHESARGRFDLR